MVAGLQYILTLFTYLQVCEFRSYVDFSCIVTCTWSGTRFQKQMISELRDPVPDALASMSLGFTFNQV